MKKGEDYTGVTVVFFCHDGNGEYLLARRGLACRDEQGRWEPGAGGLEFGERVEDTLVREIREEYGTEVLAYEFMGYRDMHRTHEGKPTHWIALDYRVLVDRAQAHNAEPHKLDEVGWFPLTAFPEPLHSQFPYFLEKYREQI